MSSNIHLFQGDCIEQMRHIAEHSVGLVIADPPYGITANKWDSVIPFEAMWSSLHRVCKENAVIALCASQPFSSALVMSNPREFRHEWIWIKNRGSNFANTVREPMKEHEHILIFSKGKWTYNKQMQPRTGGGLERVKYTFQNQTASSDNYRRFNRPNNDQGELRVPSSWQKFNVEVGLHPTQKPVTLMRYLVKTYSNQGDVVLDFCAGSGTTGVACIYEQRAFIGIEKEQKYFDIMRKRLASAEERSA